MKTILHCIMFFCIIKCDIIQRYSDIMQHLLHTVLELFRYYFCDYLHFIIAFGRLFCKYILFISELNDCSRSKVSHKREITIFWVNVYNEPPIFRRGTRLSSGLLTGIRRLHHQPRPGHSDLKLGNPFAYYNITIPFCTLKYSQTWH